MAEYEVQKFVSSIVINKEREMMREARERVLLVGHFSKINNPERILGR